MRTLRFGLCTLALASTLALAGDVPEDVKANIQARVTGGMSPGIVVGLIGHDGSETYYAAGVMTVGKPDPVTADTIFEIGSITKTFTGTLLAEMAARGEVKLSDPVRKYLPEGTVVPKEEEREITLEDLATQRSGLPRLPDNMEPADTADPYVDYTAERLYAFLAKAKLNHPIGSTYEYSNLGVGLLGHVLTRAAKLDYDALVKARIARPLNMPVTSTTVAPDKKANLATPHALAGAKPEPVKPWTWTPATAVTGAGGLRSSARDMLRYIAANAGVPDTPLKAAMKEAQRPRAETGSKAMAVGLGWHVRRSGERMIIWHNGGTGGFHSFCGFDPATRAGVVVLANSTEDIDDIGLHLLDESQPLTAVRKTLTLDEAKLARLDGFYDIGGQTITVTHEGTQLFAQLTGQPRFPVFPKSEKLFFYKVVPAELEFDLPAEGSASGVTLHQGGRDVPAKRVAAAIVPKERKEVPIDAKLLAEYAGSYQLAPGVTLTVTSKEGRLGIQLTGQPPLDAYPESDKDFFLKVVDAQLTFTRNAEGKVDAVVLHQGGADQRAARVN
ncbi:MAG TPA: serine hydrolase [Candidatus Bathyarchaeia archaeon]|nr:serine hydrolase [Candidatus Bathyarchaeia archaeon]